MGNEMLAGMMSLLFMAAIYAFFAICLQTIATKTHTDKVWMAWIPIANLVLLLTIAKKPMWWMILFFIPVVNVIAAILIMMRVAEQREKPAWIGALVIVPFFGALVVPYLAFSS
jgi:hypothetical protein